MSKVNLIPLGGMNERGKNCYVLSVNDELIIVNAGINIPTAKKLGIESFIPDFKYIIENAEKVKGLLLTDDRECNIGGLTYLIDAFKKAGKTMNFPIYSSDFVGEKIIAILEDKNIDYDPELITVEALKPSKIGSFPLIPFRTFSMSAQSLGFILKAADKENIIIIDEFIVASERNKLFRSDLNEINRFTNYANTLLLVNFTENGENIGFTAPRYSLEHELTKVFTDYTKKIVIGTYEDDFYKIFEIIKMAYAENRKVCIINKIVETLVTYLLDNGCFPSTITKEHFISKSQIKDNKNCVILISQNPQSFSSVVEGFINGKFEEEELDFTFDNNDVFVFAAWVVNGFEKSQANMFDGLSESGINVVNLSSSVVPAVASSEDQKFLVSLLKPKSIVPISCLHMELKKYAKLLAKVNPTNFLPVDNGQIIELESKPNEKNPNEMIYSLIDNKKKIELVQQTVTLGGVSDEFVNIKERNIMQESGVVTVSLFVNQGRQIAKYFFNPVGVVNITNENQNSKINLDKEIVSKLNNIFIQNKDKQFKELRKEVESLISSSYNKAFGKYPIALVTYTPV